MQSIKDKEQGKPQNDQEKDLNHEHSYRWGKIMEDSTSSLIGGNIRISIDDDQLGILNNLPVKKYTFPSKEQLHVYQDKKKAPIRPEILKELDALEEEKKPKEFFSSEDKIKPEGQSKAIQEKQQRRPSILDVRVNRKGDKK